MRSGVTPGPTQTLVGCCLLSMVLGSIHAYSIFLDPLEATLDASRGATAAIYSVALVVLTLMVLVAHPLYRRMPAWSVAVLAGGGAAVGLLVTAGADSLVWALIGYGLLFGAANGVGYGFALQIGADANPERRGMAMGLVTAVYAIGAAGGATVLDPLIDGNDAAAALQLQALLIGGASLGAAGLLAGRARSILLPDSERGTGAPDAPSIVRIWLPYTAAVLAGLMALGHAAEIVEWAGGSEGLGTRSVVLAGVGNAIGGIGVAVTADRISVRPLLVGLPLVSFVALIAMAVAPAAAAVAALVLVALVYGAVIAVYPYAVSRYHGVGRYPVVYGRVFLGWGLAGTIGPVGAGLLFDARGGYGLALVLAAVAAIVSAGTAARLPAR